MRDVVENGPTEPLAESAPLAWELAPQLCPSAPDGCVWYHRIWQYLRLLGVITSIRTNTSFLITAFEQLAADHPRVLVCGTADYAMLAHLKHAYRRHALDVTVVDRCPTAVYLNRWYADRFAMNATTTCVDALDYVSDQPMDLICTHNFVGRFEARARRQLIARWHELLRPGGVVITTQRIRPNRREVKSSYTPEQAQQFRERVKSAAAAYGPLPGPSVDDLAAAAHEYARHQGSYIVGSAGEITEALAGEGFDIVRVDEGGGALERERDRPSSPSGRGTYRMRVIARKKR